MTKDTPNGNNSDFTVFLFLAACFLSYWLYRKAPQMINLLLAHKYISGAVFSFLINGLIFYTKKKTLEHQAQISNDRVLERPAENSFPVGLSNLGKTIYLPEAARTKHTQVVGTTSAGKTESVILPWAVHDIKCGRGFVIIDGKSDRSLLDKLYAYCAEHKRTKDFKLFSLVNIDESHTYNPLADGEPEEVAERIFASFTMENEYYRAVQFEIFKQALMIFDKAKEIPTFIKLSQAIASPDILLTLAQRGRDQFLISWAARFKGLAKDTLDERTSGLLNQLGFFTSGKTAVLFNSEYPTINIEKAMEEGLIYYFQLPVMKTPTLGMATGKMLLQNIQSAVSSRHLDTDKSVPLYSIFLDDFTEYLTPSFVTLLNKSRSANVGVVFAHQALGDLAGLGEAVKNTILTNSNLKIFMRTNENDSAEYYAKAFGTKTGTKITERQTKTNLGTEKTGEGSVRDVEEFIFHPNIFKRDLGVGEAIMIVPLNKGAKAVRLKFEKLSDIEPIQIPIVAKPEPKLLDVEISTFKQTSEKTRLISKDPKDDILAATVNPSKGVAA